MARKARDIGYYEGVLQVRDAGRETMDAVMAMVEAKEARIAKIINIKGGCDIYFEDRRALLSIGEALRKTLGGTLKKSRKLHTFDRQSSKRVYRVSVLFRPLPFKERDVVVIEREPVLIRSVGQNVRGFNLAKAKPVTFNPPSQSVETLSVEKTVVSSTYPCIEVIHPSTFQAVPARNPLGFGVKPGEKVRVVVFGDVYIVSA